MSTRDSRSYLIGRRGELMVELFLQELKPEFIAQSPPDVAYDFFVGFANSEGGINTFGVEVKATEQSVGRQYRVDARMYERLARSNIPVLLVIVNVKENRLYYAWPTPGTLGRRSNVRFVTIPVTEVDNNAKVSLRRQLTGSPYARQVED